MANFKVGDRVIGTPNAYNLIPGTTGTVIFIRGGDTSVEFDKYIDGHDCNGKGKDGYCWNCEDYEIELTNQEPNYEIY